MNRRGLAPIVSTVILLVFATGLGLVVMNWGNAVSLEEEEGCQAALSVVQLNGKPQACFSGPELHVVLDNSGLETISGFKVSVIDGAGILNAEFSEQLQYVEVKDLMLTFSRELTAVQQVKITPKTMTFCPGRALTLDDVEECA